MRKMFGLLVLALASLSLPSFVAAEGGNRVVLFQFGVGLGMPSYPAEVEDAFASLDSVPGVSRTKVAVDIAIGLAVSQEGFIMLRVDGTGDRLDDDIDYLQMNLYLYSIGFRYYPKTTGFYLEVGAGSSTAVLDSSSSGSVASEFDIGYGGAIGYDFNVEDRGFGLVGEVKYDMLEIDGDEASCLMLTLNLCWK